ncbi:unnamed protein product, partial [Meganyctiphanes norvegica]
APQKMSHPHTLNVSVSDSVHIAFTTLTVRLLTENTHPPRFRSPLFEGSVKENHAPGEIVMNISVESYSINTVLHYDILWQTERSTFALDNNGNIITQKHIDREIVSHHNIYISVRDEYGHKDFAKVLINILDTN